MGFFASDRIEELADAEVERQFDKALTLNVL